MKQRSAAILEETDMTRWFIAHNKGVFGTVVCRLKDYSAVYAERAFWVQVKDEDDFIRQAEFATIQEAYTFYRAFINQPAEMLAQMG